ncbi:MAG: Roadblock/LC7 family protein [Actinomycetia bacterium]|nr:Roadblock/LC7 family protein [Actinomycetes bacterium]
MTRNKPAVPDRITEELERIRRNVPGVRGGITASSDGLLIAHDVGGLEPTQIAALVSAMHAMAARAAVSTQCGQFKEVITRGSEGYLAVYAAGSPGGHCRTLPSCPQRGRRPSRRATARCRPAANSAQQRR